MTATIEPVRPRGRLSAEEWVRRACTLVVAGAAAYASYQHQREYAVAGGSDPVGAALWPLSVDGLLVLATVGTLLIGIHDSGVPVGLEPDFANLRKPGKDDADLFGLHLNNLIVESMGAALAANVGRQVHVIDGKHVCRIHVHPSGFPVDARVTVERNGQQRKETKFYVRTGNSTRALDELEKAKYILSRWPTS